ncbi:RES domain-containing protein [uncultured Pseudomonas sp.]|uniref:RES domain-containing protein n=1 Tax=uncultured Pseudomonas sp. TaxID=114707 RepID=UPI0030D895D3|tara:strand:- start:2851 stop:3768 length:918 start_codon:yes stop_codon:yes gene_type:complete
MNLDECEYIFHQALRSSSEAEFLHAINPLFKYYEILSLEFGRGGIFWRARLIENEPYSNLSEMDYPPAELSRAGRLNDKGSPCFYISATKETALTEIDAKEGQLIQLAGFRVLNEETIRLAVIGEYANVKKNGYMHFAGQDPDMTISKMINSMPRQDALKKIYIDNFFASVLADPIASSSEYLYSRALGQAIYSRVSAGGIAFPSVKHRSGFNVSVNAEESDRAYQNVSCIVVKIGKPRKFGMIEFEIIQSAEQLDDDLNFVWMSSREPDVIGIYGMTKDEYETAAAGQNDRNGLLNMIHNFRSS